jgi:uncharacterized membrane protein
VEKITGFLVLFIFFYLLYSYFKFKKDIKKNELEKNKEGEKNKEDGKKEIYEKHIIVAVIASIMDGKKYKIRNIFLEKEKNKENQKSAWKIAGRDYNMQRRERI